MSFSSLRARPAAAVAAATCAALACGLAAPVAARPVTYPDGVMIMTEHADETWTTSATYTIDPRWSVGLRSEFDGEEDRQFQGVEANWLAYRDNAPDAQGNVFITAAVGAASADRASIGKATEPAVLAVAEADWENRRVFVLGQVRAFWAEDVDRSVSYRGRVGVAPYVGDAGDLHTWLMLQVDHEPEDTKPVSVTPLLRLFKDTVLLEVGSSLDGDAFATVMFYF